MTIEKINKHIKLMKTIMFRKLCTSLATGLKAINKKGDSTELTNKM